jgi:cytochrome c oxidase cbb3-type subunit 3
MITFPSGWRVGAFCLAGLLEIVPFAAAQSVNPTVQTPSAARQPSKTATPQTYPPALVKNGEAVYQGNCTFCHGRDAGGGETGPDLTHSQLVADDVKGDKISEVVRNGRVEKGMPRFNLSEADMAGLVAFIHDQKAKASSKVGGRRSVDVQDLQTGSVEAGRNYFNGTGTCSQCHSPTGDLANVASRYQGLKLMQRLLYPKDSPAKITVTLPSGKTISGTLAYHDEFTVGLRDASGWYQSWPMTQVKYKIDAPAEVHADLLAKYTDDDIHNLMAYLQTLRGSNTKKDSQ